MKARFFFAAALAAALAVAASTASAKPTGSKHALASKITVWLQVDAQSGWPNLVAAANQQFQAKHPGATVDVQYQTWGDHLSKFDATLAGGNTPDVIEMGNTEMTKYMAAGAFANLSSQKGSFPNSKNWLKGLAASGNYNGRTYGVPYYAGSRVVTYRTDLFRKARAKVPTSLGQFTATAKRLKKQNPKRGFSPVYIAGTDWYFAMSFVYDYGGQIAQRKGGKWVGRLESKKARAGLAAYKRFFNAASRASKTGTENRPQPYDVYARGQAASIIGPAWFSCCVGKKYTKATKQFVMPSHAKGKAMPGFLGGSDLAVPAGSNDKSLATDWIRIFTSTASQRGLQAKGNIPNATNLLGNSVNERAAKRSWFVPTAKNWVNVENGNVLRTMLARILTGRASIAEATAWADDNIALTLNQ
ncbi:MAG TPA: extracellular solute-binding protein [Gaiellaceae bacterium]|jgi:N,N'-diacetylchitobiose transport system substrate-binding protein|nr:extracellular solute-binding protein [Gaiellaceae bacterium]